MFLTQDLRILYAKLIKSRDKITNLVVLNPRFPVKRIRGMT